MPATGEIYQMTYQQALNGQVLETVLHFREKTGTSTPAQIATSADLYWALVAPCQSTNVIYGPCIVKQMTPVAFDETINPATSAPNGSDGHTPVNNTLAVILTKRTGTAGKTHRGRMYIGGVSGFLLDTDNNKVAGTGPAVFGTFQSSLINLYGPAGTDAHLQLGIYSRVLGGSSPFTLAGWQPVTKLDLQIVVGNQRRRRLGVGI